MGSFANSLSGTFQLSYDGEDTAVMQASVTAAGMMEVLAGVSTIRTSPTVTKPAVTIGAHSVTWTITFNAPISGGTYNGRQRFFHPFQLVDAMGTDGLYTTPKMWIDEFVKTAMIDLAGAASGNPVTGEGRNSVGMDKYKFRGNSYSNGGSDFAEHIFEHQSDMPSQENRDFFDARIENAV